MAAKDLKGKSVAEVPAGSGKFFKTDVTEVDGIPVSSVTYKTNAEGTERGQTVVSVVDTGDGKFERFPADDLSPEEAQAWNDPLSPENEARRTQITELRDDALGPNESQDPNAEAGASADAPTNSNTQQKSSVTSGPPLVYPVTRPSNMDYLKVTPYEYEASGSIGGQGGGSFSVGSGSSKAKKAGRPVFLPMQPALQDSNSVSWGNESLNPLQAAGANLGMKVMDNMQQGQWAEALQGAVKDIGDLAKEALNDPLILPALKSYMAGQAVGANILTRASGLVLNNNLELLFNGPTLRSFNYSYRFTPRSASEASTIKEIIRLFKIEMAVKRDDVGLFLKTPNVFGLQYIYGSTGEEHPFMNRIKICALTNMNVDYTPDGSYMTYNDGSMTSYNVSLQFAELDPIYRDDQEESTGMGY